MCNLYSDLLTFLCILLVHRDWFCLFFNTRSDFWVLFDMSVIYFIYIDAVMCLRFGRHDSSYPKSCFYCRTPFSVEQKKQQYLSLAGYLPTKKYCCPVSGFP